MPYRAIYWLFSFIVLPRRNHRMSRWIFRRQSRRLTPGEYLKWVELVQAVFPLIKAYVNRKGGQAGLGVMGSQDHIFFGARREICTRPKEHAPGGDRELRSCLFH